MKKSNYSYIGISFIILVFGIIFIPRIIERLQSGDVTRNERMSRKNIDDRKESSSEELSFLTINGELKTVPDFSFTNQNGKTITNKDYIGKVYVVEFFFTTCPSICPKMNANMIELQNHFRFSRRFWCCFFYH